MNDDLQSALRSALAATQECNPADLDQGDRELWRTCDQRCEQIIEVLIREHDEAGPAARQLLNRFALRGYSGEPRSSNA